MIDLGLERGDALELNVQGFLDGVDGDFEADDPLSDGGVVVSGARAFGIRMSLPTQGHAPGIMPSRGVPCHEKQRLSRLKTG